MLQHKQKHTSSYMTTYDIVRINEEQKYNVERKNGTIGNKNEKRSSGRAKLLKIKRNTEN